MSAADQLGRQFRPSEHVYRSHEVQVVTSKGLPLTMRVKTDYYPPEHEDGEYFGGSVTAIHGEREVGYLPFGHNHGNTRIQIGDLEVARHARRKGVATAMLEHARSLGIPVEHNEDESTYSPAGLAFRRAHER